MKEEIHNISVPSLIYYGCHNGNNVLVCSSEGLSLKRIFLKKKSKFSLKTILMIGIQLNNRIEAFHTARIIHRDVRPDNILISAIQKDKNLVLGGIGLSKKYISTDEVHIPFKMGKSMVGSARFCSLAASNGE